MGDSGSGGLIGSQWLVIPMVDIGCWDRDGWIMVD